MVDNSCLPHFTLREGRGSIITLRSSCRRIVSLPSIGSRAIPVFVRRDGQADYALASIVAVRPDSIDVQFENGSPETPPDLSQGRVLWDDEGQVA